MSKPLIPFFIHNTLFITGVFSSSSLSASQLGSRQASRQTICYLQPYWEMQISSTTGTFSYWHKIKRWTMSILSNHFPILYPLLHSKKGLFIIECWLFDINASLSSIKLLCKVMIKLRTCSEKYLLIVASAKSAKLFGIYLVEEPYGKSFVQESYRNSIFLCHRIKMKIVYHSSSYC